MTPNDWPTTRTFPRTLAEAFPNEHTHAYAITKYTLKPLNYSDIVTIICTVIVLSLTIYGLNK
jgi:hypothetical protein